MVQESILHYLKRNGLELTSVAEPDLGDDGPSRKLMRQITGAFHEYERQMIVVKLRAHGSELARLNAEGTRRRTGGN